MSLRKFIAVALAIACASFVTFGCRRSGRVQDRVTDVQKLIELHGAYGFTNTELSQLLLIAEKNGVRLPSRISKESSNPSHRIIRGNSNDISSLVIEETASLHDEGLIVKGYADGSVVVTKK